MNSAIKGMQLPALESVQSGERLIRLFPFENEDLEHRFVISRIKNENIPRSEIFVLARTNRQLEDLSRKMREQEIPHMVKNESGSKTTHVGEEMVTLATIHAIKGLEAKVVFVIGCTDQHFPCKTNDHPVIEMMKLVDYDREEEERRLFYVAISRAKKQLFLTYPGKKSTYFITEEMEKLLA